MQQSGRGDIFGAEEDAMTVPPSKQHQKTLKQSVCWVFFERTSEMERVRLQLHADG